MIIELPLRIISIDNDVYRTLAIEHDHEDLFNKIVSDWYSNAATYAAIYAPFNSKRIFISSKLCSFYKTLVDNDSTLKSIKFIDSNDDYHINILHDVVFAKAKLILNIFEMVSAFDKAVNDMFEQIYLNEKMATDFQINCFKPIKKEQP